jgi:hypothetical protein
MLCFDCGSGKKDLLQARKILNAKAVSMHLYFTN